MEKHAEGNAMFFFYFLGIRSHDLGTCAYICAWDRVVQMIQNGGASMSFARSDLAEDQI